jgi:Spy/CpxP family protein refolding chaperone
MIAKISLTLIGAALAGALVYAQTTGTTSPTRTPPTPATMAQMRVNRLAAELSLTDAQKTSALSIYTTAYTNAQTVQTNLRTAQTSLRDAIKTNNTAQIDTLATAIGTATGQLAAINAKADAAFYAILTTDQKAIYDAHPAGGRGPGGMGGPGGPGMMRGRRGQ